MSTTVEIDNAAELRAVIGRLSRRLRPTPTARRAGLTPTRVSILLTVVRSGPVRLADLATGEGINPTMLSRVIADFVDAGLVQRTSDEADRRSAWVRPTAAGKRLAEQMRRERTDAVKAAMAGLREVDQRRIEQALPALEALAEQLGEVRR